MCLRGRPLLEVTLVGDHDRRRPSRLIAEKTMAMMGHLTVPWETQQAVCRASLKDRKDLVKWRWWDQTE